MVELYQYGTIGYNRICHYDDARDIDTTTCGNYTEYKQKLYSEGYSYWRNCIHHMVLYAIHL